MQIDESDEHSENAQSGRIDSFDAGSNVTRERDAHRAKQDLPSFSREAGMQIDTSEEQLRNASNSMHVILESDSKVTRARDEH
jgi:hypothetical protein